MPFESPLLANQPATPEANPIQEETLTRIGDRAWENAVGIAERRGKELLEREKNTPQWHHFENFVRGFQNIYYFLEAFRL